MTTRQRREIKAAGEMYGIEIVSYQEGKEKGVNFLGLKTTSYPEAHSYLAIVRNNFQISANTMGRFYNP